MTLLLVSLFAGRWKPENLYDRNRDSTDKRKQEKLKYYRERAPQVQLDSCSEEEEDEEE